MNYVTNKILIRPKKYVLNFKFRLFLVLFVKLVGDTGFLWPVQTDIYMFMKLIKVEENVALLSSIRFVQWKYLLESHNFYLALCTSYGWFDLGRFWGAPNGAHLRQLKNEKFPNLPRFCSIMIFDHKKTISNYLLSSEHWSVSINPHVTFKSLHRLWEKNLKLKIFHEILIFFGNLEAVRSFHSH